MILSARYVKYDGAAIYCILVQNLYVSYKVPKIQISQLPRGCYSVPSYNVLRLRISHVNKFPRTEFPSCINLKSCKNPNGCRISN
jgi:hypothetical protein